MGFQVCQVDGWCPASSIQTWSSPHHKNQRVEWVVWFVHTDTPEWNQTAAYLWVCVRHFCVCVCVCPLIVSAPTQEKMCSAQTHYQQESPQLHFI